MAEVATEQARSESDGRVFEFGGLRFDVSFRGRGPTLRVLGPDGPLWAEMLRFDDFAEEPHFHAPPADRFAFDRSLGDPLAWFIAQVRDHLAEWLERAGFAAVLARVDVAEVTRHAEELERAMAVFVPDGYTRVPGRGLQPIAAPPAPA
ncbi:MAG TPA: hypothetical protein VNF07_01095 [Acidimicrobiales bacterium]|nr:hypothetical protein [Acidimicrobiales bacterium]